MIFVIATLKTTEKDRDALLEACKACIVETQKEDGCLSYDLHANINAPETLVFVERWRDREALEAHFKSPHISVLKEVAGPLIVEQSVEIISPDAVEKK
ncbi:putative quinol monooxygenase [Roseibium sediminicola]|uniref:Antibiotic biosynthesis monooxygenase n=1 Tax=Roseibium sediminicola TaxID=2933272 RepID=A0ABT0GRL8_9HYPH|nr:putative quinol monooxygenase [Roseibium sp. CAU 1639]MCK7612094.1 antibiotic biosynthesis monooxygenase [Roseibium sp. CAU 1639]